MSVDGSLFLCRLCLKSDAWHVNVFDSNRTDGIMVFEVIQDLLQIEVTEGDGLPSTACRDCCAKLREFSDFKKMCIRSARELKRKSLTHVMGVDGQVPRNSQTRPVEVFVKVGEDCGLPLNCDVSSVERDPLCMSEKALPSTLITMSDDRVFREERFSESSPAAGNPIVLRRVKPEVDDNALETSSLSLSDVSAQQGSTNAMSEEEDGRGGVVHGREEGCTVDEHQDRLLSEDNGTPQGCQSYDLHSNQKKRSRFGSGSTFLFNYSKLGERCKGNGDLEEMSGIDQDGSGICGSMNERMGVHGVSSCCPRGNVSLLDSVEVLRGADVNTRGEVFEGDMVDGSGWRIERRTMSEEVKVFRCDCCGHEFQTKESIQKHLRHHNCSVSVYNCGLCFMGFIRKEEYERHSLVEHGIGPDDDVRLDKRNSHRMIDTGDRFDSNCNAIATGNGENDRTDKSLHPCQLCTKTFSRKSHLKSHAAVHTKEKPYLCGVCTKSFTTKSNLNAHMTSLHSDSKRHRCSVCFKSFARRGILKAHMTLHTKSSPHSCTVCTKSFTTEAILKAHRALHTGVSPHMCTICSKAFTTDSNLKTHLLTHTGVRAHICGVCTKTFPTKSVLKVHMSVHVERKPYSCKVCGKAFTRKYILKEHAALHSGDRPYSCAVCGKSFVAKGILKTHMVLHSGSRPHSCATCSKTFTTKGNLKSHQMVHSGIKPHRCAICSRSFPTKGNLNAHIMVHSGERPHKCNICAKTFTRKGNLKKHSELHKADSPETLNDDSLHKT